MSLRTFDRPFVITAVETLAGTLREVIHSHPQVDHGRQHAMNTAQWQRDLKRREELDALGWRLIVVTAQDLYDAPEQVLVRVRAALIERGTTGIRRQFKTEWLRYFTVS